MVEDQINMEKEDLNKPILLVFIILICCIQKGTGVATFLTAFTYCTSSTANIDFNISLNAGETVVLTRTWYFGSTVIAESDGITLTSYVPRLTAYGTYGISLRNVTVADAGNYTYAGTSSTTGNPFAATSTLSIQVAPTTGCSPHGSQSGSKVQCTMDTGSGKCGTAPIYTDWLNETGISSTFECDKKKQYICCGVADSQSSCSWNPNEFCIMYTCNATSTSSTTTFISDHKENHCPDELHIAGGIGLAIIILGVIIQIVLFIIKGDQCTLGFGICFVIEIIGCIINIVALALKGYQLKLGLGICFGIIMFACIIGIIILVFVKNGDFRRLGHCICFVIIIIICICCIVILAKKGEECQQSFLIGFGIGFGILIIGCIIIILILIFFKIVIIQNKDASPRTNEKEFTITAIVYGLFISVEWFKEKTLLESNEDFTIEPYDNKTRKSNLIIKSLSMKNSATYICRAKNRCGCCSAEDSITLPHDKDKHQPGSSADVSRNDVELQVVETGAKSNDKERPPAFHAGTQNKTEPKTASKQTYDIHQPLPSVDRGVEDKPKLRPQPLPPQNSDTKDRNQRGISATIDNPPGLANETPRLNKLPPLTQKQPILQEEGAAEEPKKKRKKKKKKDQTNEGNPEEEVVGFEITSMTIMTKIN